MHLRSIAFVTVIAAFAATVACSSDDATNDGGNGASGGSSGAAASSSGSEGGSSGAATSGSSSGGSSSGGSSSGGSSSGGSSSGGSSSGGTAGDTSGVTQSKGVTELTPAEKEMFCDWQAERTGGYGHKTECGDGSSVTVVRSKEQCISRLPTANCAATVAEFEDCVNALHDDACTGFTNAACAPIVACAK